MTISSCCTFLYAAFPGLLSANQLAWLTLTDICVLLSPQDSPEHPGAGRAGGSDPPQPGPQPGNAATRKVTPPGLLGAGNSTGVLLFEKIIKAGGEGGSSSRQPRAQQRQSSGTRLQTHAPAAGRDVEQLVWGRRDGSGAAGVPRRDPLPAWISCSRSITSSPCQRQGSRLGSIPLSCTIPKAGGLAAHRTH